MASGVQNTLRTRRTSAEDKILSPVSEGDETCTGMLTFLQKTRRAPPPPQNCAEKASNDSSRRSSPSWTGSARSGSARPRRFRLGGGRIQILTISGRNLPKPAQTAQIPATRSETLVTFRFQAVQGQPSQKTPKTQNSARELSKRSNYRETRGVRSGSSARRSTPKSSGRCAGTASSAFRAGRATPGTSSVWTRRAARAGTGELR